MLRSFLRQVCRHAQGRVVMAGAIGVLSGIECLMSAKKTVPPAVANVPIDEVPKARTRCFEIRRTKSELGYTYWVLRGFGAFRCFELHDTWQEAMNEATGRLEPAASVPPTVSAVAV